MSFNCFNLSLPSERQLIVDLFGAARKRQDMVKKFGNTLNETPASMLIEHPKIAAILNEFCDKLLAGETDGIILSQGSGIVSICKDPDVDTGMCFTISSTGQDTWKSFLVNAHVNDYEFITNDLGIKDDRVLDLLNPMTSVNIRREIVEELRVTSPMKEGYYFCRRGDAVHRTLTKVLDKATSMNVFFQRGSAPQGSVASLYSIERVMRLQQFLKDTSGVKLNFHFAGQGHRLGSSEDSDDEEE